MATERTALLIIRAWHESDSALPLRATIRFTGDITTGFQPGVSFSDAAGVLEVVRTWLHDMDQSQGTSP